MKLELTLPERPGLLHAVPVLDIFGLLGLSFVIGPSLVHHAGVTVDLPPSRFQLERYQETMVVTLGGDEAEPRIHIGRNQVNMEQLQTALKERAATADPANIMVLLQTDQATSVGLQRRISETIIAMGYRLALVGASAHATTTPQQD
jgi:biopolymer transport protein ExbD